MNGLTFRRAVLAFSFLSMVFLPTLTLGSSSVADQEKAKIYDTQSGCLGCHQGNQVGIDNDYEASQDKLNEQNKAQFPQSG